MANMRVEPGCRLESSFNCSLGSYIAGGTSCPGADDRM
jgi:hypothetical protein